MQKRIFLWKSLFITLTTFLCLVKEVRLSLDLHTLSSHFNLSCSPPCQQSHFCRVKIKCEKKIVLGLLFPFFSPSFMLIQRLNEFSMFLHTSFLHTSCFPIAPAGLHCLHWHWISKGCKKRWCHLGNWGKEKQHVFLAELCHKAEIWDNKKLLAFFSPPSFSRVSTVQTFSWCTFDIFIPRYFFTNPVFCIFLQVTGT